MTLVLAFLKIRLKIKLFLPPPKKNHKTFNRWRLFPQTLLTTPSHCRFLDRRLPVATTYGYLYTSQKNISPKVICQKNISLNVLLPELTIVRNHTCQNEHLPEITSARMNTCLKLHLPE